MAARWGVLRRVARVPLTESGVAAARQSSPVHLAAFSTVSRDGDVAPASWASKGSAATAWTVAAAAAGLTGLAATGHLQAPVAHAEAAASLAPLVPGAAIAPAVPDATAAPDAYALPPPAALRGMPREFILYQYEVCPFCCKVKAFLDYHKIPYRTVEVSPLTKRELKSWSQFRKVPVALLDGEALTDSSAIISRLAAELAAARQQQRQQAQGGGGGSSSRGGEDSASSGGWLFSRSKGSKAASADATAPTAPVAESARAEEERWRRWVDERLVRVVTVNIYRTAGESWQTFDYITQNGNFGLLEREAARVVGAGMMWAISGRLQKKYGIEGDLRQQLYAAANEWVDALGNRRFMGGAAPNMADLSVFGVLRAVTGTDTFMDVMHNSRIGRWYEAMMGAVGDSSRLPGTV